jgi:hypothetical protein
LFCGAIKTADPTAPSGLGDMVGPTGQPLYPTYDNKPSITDRELMNDVNALRSRPGQNWLSGALLRKENRAIQARLD